MNRDTYFFRPIYSTVLVVSILLLSTGCQKKIKSEQTPAHYNKQVITSFESVIDSVSKVTEIPVVLPDLDSLSHVNAKYITPVILMLEKKYDICFNGTRDFCAGVSSFGSVSGYHLESDTLAQVKDIFHYDANWGPEISNVKLTKNFAGWFMESTWGANCNEAKVIWPMQGYLYKVGYEAAPKEFMIKLANSAITNQKENFLTRSELF